MVTLTYAVFAIFGCVLGAAIGALAHYLRANFSAYPERVLDGGIGADLINDIMSPHSIVLEKHVLGAEWDQSGFWDGLSNRNLAIYVGGGVLGSLALAAWFWNDRVAVVASICAAMRGMGLEPPTCPLP
jgi:hypothetical protein